MGLPSGFVRAAGFGRFELDGAAYAAHGVNSYPLLQHAAEGRLDAISDILSQAISLGRPLVRALAFCDYGSSPARIRDADAGLREQGLRALDCVLTLAAARGVRLILVLANYWRDFGGAPAILEHLSPRQALPPDAFFTDSRALAAQLDYQNALVSRVNSLTGCRYGDDPTIFAWELINEARCDRSRAQRGHVLARWARCMSEGLRAAGAKQLVAWGGSGYLGQHGEDLQLIAAQGAVDVLTMHFYGITEPSQLRAAGVEAAITKGIREIRKRAAISQKAGLPLLLEELNWKPISGQDGERARVLGAWLRAAHDLGVSCLPWMIGERGRPDYDGYLIRPEHAATWEILHQPARQLPAPV
jgi:mannan endo-1,4-beta-mannosidase